MIYEYQCPKCKQVIDELRSSFEDSRFALSSCLICNEPMSRIISASKGYVKGTDTPCKNK